MYPSQIETKEYERDHRSAADLSEYEQECLDKFEKVESLPNTNNPHRADRLTDFNSQGMGMVLRNAWKHVEALQSTDVSGLLNHISAVLGDIVQVPERIERFSKVRLKGMEI